jgi:hypothetical protein
MKHLLFLAFWLAFALVRATGANSYTPNDLYRVGLWSATQGTNTYVPGDANGAVTPAWGDALAAIVYAFPDGYYLMHSYERGGIMLQPRPAIGQWFTLRWVGVNSVYIIEIPDSTMMEFDAGTVRQGANLYRSVSNVPKGYSGGSPSVIDVTGLEGAIISAASGVGPDAASYSVDWSIDSSLPLGKRYIGSFRSEFGSERFGVKLFCTIVEADAGGSGPRDVTIAKVPQRPASSTRTVNGEFLKASAANNVTIYPRLSAMSGGLLSLGQSPDFAKYLVQVLNFDDSRAVGSYAVGGAKDEIGNEWRCFVEITSQSALAGKWQLTGSGAGRDSP